MKKYIGTKAVEAEPMTKGDAYGASLLRSCPELSEQDDLGYKVRYEDGYESWSPKDVFEKAYHESMGSGLPFGIALEQVKLGRGMRLPFWKEDVVIRLAVIPENVDTKEGIMANSCTDAGIAIHRDLESQEETYIKRMVQSRIHEQMTAPFLYVESRFGRVPWKETMIELLSNDWEVVD